MNIVFVASECTPFAKTGGLADVVGTLPRWIKSLGHNVIVIIPKYRCITPDTFNIHQLIYPVPVFMRRAEINAPVWCGKLHGNVPIYFIEHSYYFDREYLYGSSSGDYEDNDHRFIFFARAALSLIDRLGFKADIVHCHDWQTGLISAYLAKSYRHLPVFNRVKTVFTIHNIGYQGIFDKRTLEKAELDWSLFTLDGLEYYDQVSFLKAGIAFSDAITTVSPTYAREIQSSSEYGSGMEGILCKRSSVLHGIINGIDYREWNPETDSFIPAHFSLKNMRGKSVCKRSLQKKFNLSVSASVPCIGIVSRLAAQKGFDLIKKILNRILHHNIQLIVLGTGDILYHQLLDRAVKRYRKNLGIALRFDNALAHTIYAGCDFFLMPSHYEPCGLGQMIAMRYGTIPIVTSTGGLADTVIDYTDNPTKGNGFVADTYNDRVLWNAVMRAIQCWRHKKDRQSIITHMYSSDFRWKASARAYCAVYKKIRKKS